MGWFSNEEEDGAWRTASLRYVGGRLVFPNYMGPSQHAVDHAKSLLPSARTWIASIEDRRMRRECQKWYDHSIRCIEQTEHELKTHKIRDHYDRIGAQSKRESAKAADILSRFR